MTERQNNIMKVRILTGLGIGLVAIPLFIFSDYIVYPLFLGMLSALGVWELLRVFGLHKKWVVSLPSYLIGACLPVFAHKWFTPRAEQRDYILLAAAVLFSFLLYLAAICVFDKEIAESRKAKDPKYDASKMLTFPDVASVFLSVAYVSVSFTSMVITRYLEHGEYIFGLVFIAAWVCDTFAYFTGRLFGKHKLAPHLSPKKTVEGSIGGIVFAVGGCMLYGLIIDKVTNLSANYLVLALLGLFLSIFAQVGDIWASLIKREHGIKDYSRMLPGHGGVMDRFDSILAIAAILMAVCMVFPPFT